MGEITFNHLKLVTIHDPITYAIYGKNNDLLEEEWETITVWIENILRVKEEEINYTNFKVVLEEGYKNAYNTITRSWRVPSCDILYKLVTYNNIAYVYSLSYD